MQNEDSIWILESPLVMVAGEQIAFSVDWQGAANVANPTAQVFKNGADITAQTMDAADQHLVNGNVQTLKRLRARPQDGGARYVLLVQAEVDGNLERRKLLVHVARAGEEH
ncbi:MAG: hypothetical protein KIS80_05410 [Anaerolineales bacterium]|nr:hypothetical protein [Anaerolineales bacterium]